LTSFSGGFQVSKGIFTRSGQSRRAVAGALVVLAALIVGALALVTNAGASLRTPRLVQVQRAAVLPAGVKALAKPSRTSTQTGDVALKPRDPAALSAFLAHLIDRRSASYHRYLAAGQFAERFGPTHATIAAVTSTLTHDGLKVKGVSGDGMLIKFSGSTARVQAAFSTRLARYRTSAGVTGEATTTAVKLPSTISGDVSAIIGLNTLVKPVATAIHAPKSAYAGRAAAQTADITSYPSGAPAPCSAATAAANAFGGLTDDQIANAYGAFGLYQAGDTGAGVSVAIFEQEPFDPTDLQAFDKCYFGANHTPGGLAIHNTDESSPQTGPGEGEAILDVEDVSALAPGAHIDVYDAPPSNEAGIDEYAQMVDADQDKIISSSYGFCEQDEALAEPGSLQTEDNIFEQAAAQGQTVLNATGDTGSDACNEVRSVPVPTDQNPVSIGDAASQPYVLAVGGTTIQDADPAHYDETTWNDGATWGGGNGGISSIWAAPSWQLAVPGFPMPGGTDYTNANTVESTAGDKGISDQDWPTGFCANNSTAGLTTGTPCRGTPDVSADSDEFTGGVTIYAAEFGGWATEGGTSSATPIWAGLLALVDASPACQSAGVSASTGIGFVSPLLYAVAANSTEYADSFHDITSGNNDVYGLDDGKIFPAHTGYDLATGLGSPNLTNADGTPGLADNLCALAGTASTAPSISSLSPTSAGVAGGSTLTVHGSGFTPGDGVSVSGLSIGSYEIPASAVTVVSDSTLTVKLPAASATLASGDTTTTDSTSGVTYQSAGSTGVQDGSGPADVVVTLSNGQSTRPTSKSQLSYVDKSNRTTTPSVSSISPSEGAQAGGGPVTIYGSGFKKGETVTFGGSAATVVAVKGSHELKVTAPAESAASGTGTDCQTASALTAETNESDPDDVDICQTSVIVTSGSVISATDAPLPVYEGPAPEETQDGLPEVPTGYELTPQPTEYDYVPTPTITSVSTVTSDPASLADASGGTVVELTGTGLDLQSLYAVTVGDPTVADSNDYDDLYASGTTLVVDLPADPNVAPASTVGPEPDPVAIGVLTVAGQSSGQNVTYAGIPVVSAVSTGTSDGGLPVAPDAGGTPLTITGQGFSDITGPLEFTDPVTAASFGESFSDATQYTYDVASDTEVDTQTLQTNPALLDTLACTVSGCSSPSTADQLLEYPPGNPQITGVDVSSGPADGGTTVTLTGENLGCVTGVSFGSEPALEAANTPALLDCGATNSVTVITPPGTLGDTVPITLSTIESDVQNPPVTATSPTPYTYTANPTITPESTSFGSVDIGSTASATITVQNSTDGPLVVGKPSETIGSGDPDPNAVDVVSGTCTKKALAVGGSCAINLAFSPTVAGNDAVTLNVPFNNSPTPLTVALSGTGVVPTLTNTVTSPTSPVTTPGSTVTTPAGTVTSAPVTVTETVTTPALTETVTTPGQTVTQVTKPAAVTRTVICTTATHNRYVSVKVKKKVQGKTVSKRVRKRIKVRTRTCTTTTTRTPDQIKTQPAAPALKVLRLDR
jgi:hypothetical protein